MSEPVFETLEGLEREADLVSGIRSSRPALPGPGEQGHECDDCYEDPISGTLFHPTLPPRKEDRPA